MRFRLLGPLEVDGLADARLLRRSKPRALLAILLLNANRPVSTARLVEGLWGDDEPASAIGALQNYVSQLRKALGPETVVTRAPGYMAALGADDLDVARFERLVRQAATADVEQRAALLRDALALWRGPPLADLVNEPFAPAEARRLEELLLSAAEERVAADLELGRHADVVVELESLIAEHPLRERLRTLLMLALYRCGRQADALAAYRDARRVLDDELGLEPGEELQRLERAILRHDPAIAAPAGTRHPPGMPTVPPGRRTVTVLFADVSGSTALGESLDPEALREVMAGFFDETRVAVERHGGIVEKFAGDEVMAVFGVPVAHEDDALRAVRAAGDMVASVAALDERLDRERGVRFRVRVGVNTGGVVSGEAAAGGTFVTGAAVNLGKRLQEAAEPGEIVLGPTTYALVRDAVEAAPLGKLELRGAAAPVAAYRLVGVDAGATGSARALDTPLVGRGKELAALLAEVASVRAERRARLVAVIGDAGIGKTRLARELVGSVEAEARVLVGRCVPYGEGATYLPLVDALADARDELADAVADADDGELVRARIAALFGGDVPPAASGETAWAVRRALELLAPERELVLVFDDVHWAEPTFLDLLEYVAAWTVGAPVLVLALARPDVLDERPGWADAEGVATLRLGPLTSTETRALVEGLAGGAVDAAAVERVVGLAEGYPLFAEQLVAYLAEAGGDVDLDAVPATVEALLASRLDRLDRGERAVLERAAVIGREFWRGAVVALTPERELGGVTRHLLSLVRRGLVRPAPSELPGEDALRFHHVLVRDVAYAGVSKSVRAEAHERAADWLEHRAGGPDEVVGYHLEQAFRYRAELGPVRTASRLAADAGDRLGRAGLRALARGDARAAVTLLRRATDVLLPGDVRRIELLCELGISQQLAGELAAAIATLDGAVAEAADSEKRVAARARLERAQLAIAAGDAKPAELVAAAEAAFPVFEAVDDHRALGRAWMAWGWARGSFACDNRAWEEALERALRHYREAGWSTATPLQHVACLFWGPRPAAEAIARCDELLRADVTDAVGEAHVTSWRATLAALTGAIGEAHIALARARRTYEELLQPINVDLCDWRAAFVHALAGDAADAERLLRRLVETARQRGESAILVTWAAGLADALWARGCHDEALRWSDVARTSSDPDDLSAQFTWRAVHGKVLAELGEADEAQALVRHALELVDGTDCLNQRASVRRDLAHVLVRAGRRQEASDAAEEAARLYEQKGNVPGAARARELVAAAPG